MIFLAMKHCRSCLNEALLLEEPGVGYRKLHEKLRTEENFKEISLKKVPSKPESTTMEGWKAGWKEGSRLWVLNILIRMKQKVIYKYTVDISASAYIGAVQTIQ